MHSSAVVPALVLIATGCATNGRDVVPPSETPTAAADAARVQAPSSDAAAAERERMVRDQIEARGITSPAVLAAMRRVPRDRFIPAGRASQAHGDYPVEIGNGQTISQPYVVALMSELARIEPGDRVLEVGTGSGYQAAVLAEMGAKVWTIEIVEPLARSAEKRLRELGYGGVVVRHGDGYAGWPDQAPFDAIVITAAPPEIPRPLLDQLAPGGRLVAPVGRWSQELVVVTRGENGFESETVAPVRFVPMTGEAQKSH